MDRVKKTHILHLLDGALRWVTLRREGRQSVLDAHGELAGEAPEVLERWADAAAPAGDAVRLYDGRPRYYTFALALPAAAARQQAGAVALKIRQELGVGPETVSWATRTRKRADGSGMLDLFTIVARRESMAPLAEWAERRKIGSFWVGADIDAIRCLVEDGMLAAPVVVLNGEPAGAAVYHADAAGAVIKGRVARQGEVNGSLPADLNAGLDQVGLTHARFGEGDWQWLAHQAPRIERLPASDAPRGFGERLAAGRLRSEGSRVLEGDAVLAGGVRDLLAKRASPGWLGLAPAGAATAMGSLVAGAKEQAGAQWMAKLEARLPAKGRLTLYAAIATAMFAIGIGTLLAVRARGRTQLEEQLVRIRVPEEIYRSQQAALTLIKSERLSVLPVIQAVHELTPQGMTLDSYVIGEDGVLRISVKAQDRNQADALFKAISGSPLFANVKLPEVRPERGKFAFDISAEIKDRKKPGFRR